jgi:hypothetical protein
MEQSFFSEDRHFRKQRGDEIYVQIARGAPIQMLSCRVQTRSLNTVDDTRIENFDLGMHQKIGYVVGKNLHRYKLPKSETFTLMIKPVRRKSMIEIKCQILETTPTLWTFIVLKT